MFLPVAMVLNASLTVFILHLSKIEQKRQMWKYSSVTLSVFTGAATSSSLSWWSSGRVRPPGCTTASSSPRRQTKTRSWESFSTLQREAGSTRDWPHENAQGQGREYSLIQRVGSRCTSFHPRETTGSTFLWKLIVCATNAWVRLISVHDNTSAIKCNLNIVPITSNFVCPVLSEI